MHCAGVTLLDHRVGDGSPTYSPKGVAIRARVLVVDDNVDAAEMLAAALSLRGCNVRVAHDGPEALELAAKHRFDAALLDIGLPVIDGYELARAFTRSAWPRPGPSGTARRP